MNTKMQKLFEVDCHECVDYNGYIDLILLYQLTYKPEPGADLEALSYLRSIERLRPIKSRQLAAICITTAY